MRKLFNLLIVTPLALVFIAFAVANRQFVTISFAPFSSTDPALGISLPLFIVLIGVAVIGAMAGGVAVWFGQGRWRSRARRAEQDAQKLETELADLRKISRGGPPPSAGNWSVPPPSLPPVA